MDPAFSQHISQFAYTSSTRRVTRSQATRGARSTEGNTRLNDLNSVLATASHPVAKPSSSASASSSRSNNKRPASTSEPNDAPQASSKKAAPRKRRKASKPTATTKDLRPVPDILADQLDILFCGINPGIMSSQLGHHFSHPSNRFWPALYEGGLTPTRFTSLDDEKMPEICNCGFTNLASRPTQQASELDRSEKDAGAPIFVSLMAKWRPRVVCFVGLDIFTSFERYLVQTLQVNGPPTVAESKGKKKKLQWIISPNSRGLQPYKLSHPMRPVDGAGDLVNKHGGTRTAAELAPVSGAENEDVAASNGIKVEEDDAGDESMPVVRDSNSSLKKEEAEPHLTLISDVIPSSDTPTTSESTQTSPIHGARTATTSYPDGQVRETLIFSMPNTSGLNAGTKPAAFAEFIRNLRTLVQAHKKQNLDTSGMVEIPFDNAE